MQTQVKERGMIFCGEMVRRLIDGTKWQTRRLMNPQPPYPDEISASSFTVERYEPCREDKDGNEIPGPEIFGAYTDDWGIASSFGGPGDRVWVRETWATYTDKKLNHTWLMFRADHSAWHDPRPTKLYNATCWLEAEFNPLDDPEYQIEWKPSIHMPRWASRLTLEITKVRVERVQEITTEDILAEGIQYPVTEGGVILRLTGKCPPVHYHRKINVPKGETLTHEELLQCHFASAWDTINGEGSWDANPFVWVYDFTPDRSK